MTLLLFACLMSLHLSFFWARLVFFRIDGPTRVGVRVIEVAGTASVVAGAVLILTRQGASVWGDTLALLVAALSAWLFAWGLRTVPRRSLTAAFSIDVPTKLLTTGAFRRMRNPFYASYLLAHALPVCASRSVWSLLPLAWMAGIYLHAALLEERKFLSSPLAQDYRRYLRRTGRFIPRLFERKGA